MIAKSRQHFVLKSFLRQQTTEFLPICRFVLLSHRNRFVMADTVSKLDDLQKLRRFLRLGNENGLYKAGIQPSLVVVSDSARIVHEFLAAERGEEVVEAVSQFLSSSAIGTNRGPALFALAICARHADKTHKTKQAAMKVFATRCTSSADLFTFITYCQSVTDKKKGWGRALKTGVQRWFDSRDGMTLAKIVTQQRTGCHWSYVDLLRVTHILPKTEGKHECKLVLTATENEWFQE